MQAIATCKDQCDVIKKNKNMKKPAPTSGKVKKDKK